MVAASFNCLNLKSASDNTMFPHTETFWSYPWLELCAYMYYIHKKSNHKNTLYKIWIRMNVLPGNYQMIQFVKGWEWNMSEDHRVSEVGLNLRDFWSNILKAGQLQCYCCRLSLTDQIQKVLKDGYPAASPGTSFRATVNFFPNPSSRSTRFSSQNLSFVSSIYTRVSNNKQASCQPLTFWGPCWGWCPASAAWEAQVCALRVLVLLSIPSSAAQPHPLPDKLVIRSVGQHSPGVSWTVLYHVWERHLQSFCLGSKDCAQVFFLILGVLPLFLGCLWREGIFFTIGVRCRFIQGWFP